MSKPKDRTGEFMRQHKRILEERTELLAKIEAIDQQTALEVRVVQGLLVEERATSARWLASNRMLESDLAIANGRIAELQAALENERHERVEEEGFAISARARLIDSIAKTQNDFARLADLIKRWEGRAKKSEYEKANAILNRRVLAGAMPSIDRRGKS